MTRNGSYSLLHDFLVIYRISNIDVRRVWHMSDGRIEVEDVWRSVLGMEVGV